MIELPESISLAKQLNDTIKGKRIQKVITGQTPHKFAFYCGEPSEYEALLVGKQMGEACGLGCMIEIVVENHRLVLGDGANIRYYSDLAKVPKKHQLYIEFEDKTALVVTVQMYGGMWAFREGTFDNKYYDIAKLKPSPLTEAFDKNYFESLRKNCASNASAKAFLATNQTIPGLGNGVLQDILFLAQIHPKRKVETLSEAEYEKLYVVLKDTLHKMSLQGGRNTEKDLFGEYGGYETLLSKKTVNNHCPRCGGTIEKASYLGGSIYFCNQCQKNE